MIYLKKNIKLFVFVVLINIVNVSGQNKKMFSDAMSKLESEDYDKAYTFFQKILVTEPDNCNINYLAGFSLFNQPEKKKKSLPYFEKAIKSTSKSYKESSYKEVNAPTGALFLYAIALQLNNKIKEAREYYIQYQSQLDNKDVKEGIYLEQKIKSCDIAEELQKTPIYYKSQLLAEPVKSKKSEYKIVFNADETSMVFESNRNGKPGLFYSHFKNNKWSVPFEITRDVGIDLNFDKFSLCSMSADGKRLYILISDEYESNLYVSSGEGNKWGNTKPLNKYINSLNMQTFASESPDGKQLYFTSNRKGSLGNLDIYVSALNEKNNWGPAKNLGENINTPFNEETPFVAPDNNTLYFSSEGHKNMGGYDIFVSKRISDTEWGIPENLGYPVNTTDDNLFFVPSKEDKKGYYVLNPEEEPHIALVDLNKKVEEPVKESKTKVEVAGVVPVKPATDSISKPIVKAIEKPEIKPEDILHNITGTISFSDNNPDMDNTFLIIKNKAGVAINTIKLSPEGKYKTQLKYGSYSFLFTALGYNKFKKPVIISANNLNDVEVNATLFPEQVVKQKAKEKVFEKPKIISSGSSINNHYTIQIAALSKVVQLSAFKNINNVEYNIGTDSLVRYHWGYFNSKTEACSKLRTIIDKGYRDAFIVPFSKFNNDSINPGYTVQVFASFHEIDTTRFGSLQDLRIFRGNDRYVRCTSGEFDDYYSAYKYLLEVISKGYSDAFIRRFDEISKL